MGSFAGVKFNECITDTGKADYTKCANTLWNTDMIGTASAKDSTDVFPITTLAGVAQVGFDSANAPKMSNKITYVQISKTTTGAFAAATD